MAKEKDPKLSHQLYKLQIKSTQTVVIVVVVVVVCLWQLCPSGD